MVIYNLSGDWGNARLGTNGLSTTLRPLGRTLIIIYIQDLVYDQVLLLVCPAEWAYASSLEYDPRLLHGVCDYL